MKMTLRKICEDIIDIEEGLFEGTIGFSYDALMSAMKPGHPGEILDMVLQEVYFDIIGGKDVDVKRLEQFKKELNAFKNEFKVKELNPVLRELREYIKTLKEA